MEYSAVALAVAAIMFFLVEFAAKVNFFTDEESMFSANEWLKLFLIGCSLAMGLVLLIIAYSAAGGDAETIKTTLLTSIYAWVLVIIVVVCMFGLYIIYLVPRSMERQEERRRKEF